MSEEEERTEKSLKSAERDMFLLWECIADGVGEDEGSPLKRKIPNCSDILVCK